MQGLFATKAVIRASSTRTAYKPIVRTKQQPRAFSRSVQAKSGAKPSYTFNMNFAVDKAIETKSFNEIIKLPPSALQGLAGRADPMFKKFKIETIEDLANWKYFHTARAIATLASVEESGKRDKTSKSNLNLALDKAFETKSFKEILEAPPSALSGLADWTDSVLKDLHVQSVGKLADFKYCKWCVRTFTRWRLSYTTGAKPWSHSLRLRQKIIRVKSTNKIQFLKIKRDSQSMTSGLRQSRYRGDESVSQSRKEKKRNLRRFSIL